LKKKKKLLKKKTKENNNKEIIKSNLDEIFINTNNEENNLDEKSLYNFGNDFPFYDMSLTNNFSSKSFARLF